MQIDSDTSINDLVNSMRDSGVLGAGRMARAADVLREIFTNPDYTVILTLAGPVVPGGLRTVVSDLLRKNLLDAIVSNGANITHDITEAFGSRHLQGKLLVDDPALAKRGIARIGDVYMRMKDFTILEKITHRLLRKAKKKLGQKFALYKLFEFYGHSISDNASILRNAARSNVPILSPGIFDSMFGLHLWTFSQLDKIEVDFFQDMNRLADVVFESKKLGVIILGGGLPKHFALGASSLRGGVDAAIQITMDRPESGSLSGATLEESITWKKAKSHGSFVNVIGDFTIIFPLLVAYSTRKK